MEKRGDSVVVRAGTLPLVVTAPHAIFLSRDDAEVHQPESLTGWLCDSLATSLRAASITWSPAEISRSSQTRAPNPQNRDPNHLLESELATNPWNAALADLLRRWPRFSCLLVDIHGRRDPVGEAASTLGPGDVDIGLGALQAEAPAQVQLLRENLAASLAAVFELHGFTVNPNPALTGRGPPPRCTVTQQAVRCGQVAVQLELSLRLRRALHADEALLENFGAALRDACLAVHPLCTLLSDVGARLRPAWASAATVASVASKLADVGIDSPAALAAALDRHDGAQQLNERLAAAGHKTLRSSTLSVMREVLASERASPMGIS